MHAAEKIFSAALPILPEILPPKKSLPENSRKSPGFLDRGSLRVYPTQRALDAYPVVRQVLRDWQEYVLDGFTPEDREELTRLMERVSDRAAAYAARRLSPSGEGGEEP